MSIRFIIVRLAVAFHHVVRECTLEFFLLFQHGKVRHRRVVLFQILIPPNGDLDDDRRKGEAFFGKAVNVGFFALRMWQFFNIPSLFELFEPVGKDIRGESFITFDELFEGFLLVDEHEFENNKRPPVSEKIEKGSDGAAAPEIRVHGVGVGIRASVVIGVLIEI